MSTLLVWKDQMQKLYAKYSLYIQKVLQFVLGILVFGTINSNIGFMKAVSSPVCTVGLAVVLAFLPVNIMVLAAVVLILIQLYALSLPAAGLMIAVFAVMYILYVRFTPKKAWLIVIAVLACVLKIPYVVPVAFGLMGTPVLIVPAVFGMISYYMIHSIKVSSSVIQGGEDIVGGMLVFIKQIFANKEMWMMAVFAAVILLLVYGVRTRAINHAWKTATAIGAVAAAVLSVAGSVALDIPYSVLWIAVDLVATAVAGVILEFLFLGVDYSRTETLQFEDDEYYYYVKAVPKVGVSVPEKQIKRITEPQAEDEKLTGAAEENKKEELNREVSGEMVAMDTGEIREADLEKSVNEFLLTKSLTEELSSETTDQKEDLGITRMIDSLGTEK